MTAFGGRLLAILSMYVRAKLQAGQPYENTSVTSILPAGTGVVLCCGGSMAKYCLPASHGDGTSAAGAAALSVNPNSTANARTSIDITSSSEGLFRPPCGRAVPARHFAAVSVPAAACRPSM